MRIQLIRLILVFLTGAIANATMADEQPVLVTVDRAKIFQVEDGAAAVIVGNPFIADVAMVDQNTVVITGKSYGTTNLVILDEDNKPIVDEVVQVQASEQGVVSVYRNSARATFSCSPICEPTLRLGDAEEAFQNTATQATSRNQLAEQAAGNR
ncbi:pilus assembly protein N-terminal domain-containing protein [Labrenzia sp. R4_1]|uniref:pilus assembly protein N-terminal domain-containing protein n=1 Tax=Labrenzia sp. R4_1 TaxID=2821106 RepID=UPI001ADA629C|nr:pilus assembly protein N-terminal domain-containing protein [Labrenzia sp. R4_1]MBO9423523.1 pilus assembly protein N-terminal domain-containing protein [Labrenzia sp. R4_1]